MTKGISDSEYIQGLRDKAETSAHNARFYSDRCCELEKLLLEVTDCSASMALNNWFTRRDELFTDKKEKTLTKQEMRILLHG